MNKDDAWSTLHGHIHINLFTKHAWRVASKLLLIGARNIVVHLKIISSYLVRACIKVKYCMDCFHFMFVA